MTSSRLRGAPTSRPTCSKSRLAGYKAPTSVEVRESIPRTATGKVQKFKLREQYWQGQARQVD